MFTIRYSRKSIPKAAIFFLRKPLYGLNLGHLRFGGPNGTNTDSPNIVSIFCDREIEMQRAFWTHLETLIESSELVIDRPKGSCHPRDASVIYPLDYGYLQGTLGSDGQEVDVWRGSLPDGCIDAVVCTVDLGKRDAEIKLLLGCTAEEKQVIRAFHTGVSVAAMLIERTSTPELSPSL